MRLSPKSRISWALATAGPTQLPLAKRGFLAFSRAAAAKIGISARSLFNLQKQHPEFLQAIQEGRQRSQLWWEERDSEQFQKFRLAVVAAEALRA
jgi:hypothetical protein